MKAPVISYSITRSYFSRQLCKDVSSATFSSPQENLQLPTYKYSPLLNSSTIICTLCIQSLSVASINDKLKSLLNLCSFYWTDSEVTRLLDHRKLCQQISIRPRSLIKMGNKDDITHNPFHQNPYEIKQYNFLSAAIYQMSHSKYKKICLNFLLIVSSCLFFNRNLIQYSPLMM